MKTITIYITNNDNDWLNQLKEYASNHKWSTSLAIREIIKGYFENDLPDIEPVSSYKKSNKSHANNNILENAKNCYLLTDNKSCSGKHIDDDTKKALKDECKLCLANRIEFDKPIIANDYRSCEFAINKSCYIKDQGQQFKYAFCDECFRDIKLWGNEAGHWGNRITNKLKG